MKAIHRMDSVAYGILMAGAANSVITGLTKVSMISRVTGRRPAGMKAYYGLVGIATMYKLVRLMAPKTKEERRLIKMAQLYDQAETYQHQAKHYGHAADILLKRAMKAVRTPISK